MRKVYYIYNPKKRRLHAILGPGHADQLPQRLFSVFLRAVGAQILPF